MSPRPAASCALANEVRFHEPVLGVVVETPPLEGTSLDLR